MQKRAESRSMDNLYPDQPDVVPVGYHGAWTVAGGSESIQGET